MINTQDFLFYKFIIYSIIYLCYSLIGNFIGRLVMLKGLILNSANVSIVDLLGIPNYLHKIEDNATLISNRSWDS